MDKKGNILEVHDLCVFAGEKQILDKVSFFIGVGESVAIMGRNGSGKSTLANVLMGHPAYRVASGRIVFQGNDITEAKPEERAAAGLFLAFQESREIAGLDLYPFLFDAHRAIRTGRGQTVEDVMQFKERLDKEVANLEIKSDWTQRYLNQDFSGGEKKKSELLQLSLAEPSLAILDEIDSGLDVDALEVAGQAIERFKSHGTSVLAVTHYNRILKYINPDKVIVMSGGKVARTGGPELAKQLESDGFNSID
jgi:Fe-S cluster assembly ATP-binding protein